MKQYLVLYRAPVSRQEQMAKATPEQAKAGMEAWTAWAKKTGPALVDLGAPLGASVSIGRSAQPGHIAGYSVLRAQSLDAAKKLLEGHPHLETAAFSIEVLEQLPVPGRE